MNHNIHTTYKILAVIACLLSTAVQAQEKRNLSLEEAVEMSLSHSNELKISQAKVVQAAAAAREAKERRLPDVKISGSYLRLMQPDVDLKIKMGSGQQQTTGENPTPSSSAAFPTVNQAAYGSANLTIPIFSGFKIQYGVDAAKYLWQATQLDAQKDKESVIQNTIAAYVNVYKSKAALELVNENLHQSEQRVKDFSNLEKNGVVARNDLLKVQLNESNISLALMDAQHNYELSTIHLNLMLGLPEQTQLVIDSLDMAVPLTASESYDYWQNVAIENRADAQALQYRIKAAQTGVKATKGEYYPSLALTGGYIAAYIPDVITLTNGLNAGIGLSYSPSSLWKTGAKVAQAKAQLAQAELSAGVLNDGIKLQVAQAHQAYLSARQKLRVYNKATEQANENYRIMKNKYQNALATATELLEADVAQLQANINRANGKADVLVAYKRLLQATGTIEKQ